MYKMPLLAVVLQSIPEGFVIFNLAMFLVESAYFASSVSTADIIEKSALVLLLITVFAIFSVHKIFNELQENIGKRQTERI